MSLVESKAKNTSFSQKKTLNVGGKLISLEKPRVMGILNITPDSFYAGSQLQRDDEILAMSNRMIEEGADFLDVGGFSTRPGAEMIPENEETIRILNAIKLISKNWPDIIISVDTFRASVARKAIDAGAQMINDISGGQMDPEMFDTVAMLKVPYVLMHMRGTPQTMQSLTNYENLLQEIAVYFRERVMKLQEKGVADIIIDPGFGFAKTIEQNYELLKNLAYFRILNLPILVGLSRKSMIYKVLDGKPEDALNGTTVLNTIALMNQASILRVHDVKSAVEAVNLAQKILR